MLRKKISLMFICFILLPLYLHSQQETSQAVKKFAIDRVVAIVNDEAITMTDLQRSLIPLIRQFKDRYSGQELKLKIDEATGSVLNQLIDNKLILHTATSLKDDKELRIPEKEIMKYVQKIIDRFPSKEVFEESLKQENLSYEDFKKDCIEQLMVKKLVSQEVSSKVLVSNEDIRKYYDDHIRDYTSPSRLTFSQIWLKKEGDIEAKKKLLAEIKQKLDSGEDFKTMAVQFSEDPHASQGGIWKNVEKGQFTPELDDILWNLKPFQLSDLIETPVGFHIVRVDLIEKPRVIPINEVWADIQDNLYFERAEKIRQEWITKLRQDAYIRVFYEEK